MIETWFHTEFFNSRNKGHIVSAFRKRIFLVSCFIFAVMAIALGASTAFAESQPQNYADAENSNFSAASDEGQTNIYGLFYEDGTFIIQKGPESKNGKTPKKTISLDERLRNERSSSAQLKPIYAELSSEIACIKCIIINDYIKVNNAENFFGISNSVLPTPAQLAEIRNIANLDISDSPSTGGMFNECSALKQLDLSSFNTSNVTDMHYMFRNCSSLVMIDLSNFDTSKVTWMESMFEGCSSIKTIDAASFDVSNARVMRAMFRGCTLLESIDLSTWESSAANDLGCMFSDCGSLKKVDLSLLKMPNVMSMESMFRNCKSLTEINLKSAPISYVNDLGHLFDGCTSLQKVDLSGFDASRVFNMGRMFTNCISLTKIDISNFKTPNLTSTFGMFSGCRNLKEINISELNMQNVKTVRAGNDDESPFIDVDLGPWVYKSARRDMFKGCTSLKKVSLPASNFRDVLPTPSSKYIKCATGKWVNTKGKAYNVNSLPTSVSDTYTAQISNNLSQANISVKDCIYSGKKLMPKSITVKLFGTVLKKNQDYTVTCKGGIKVGSYKVTVKGKGTYKSSKTAVFKIVPKGTSLSNIKSLKKGLSLKWRLQKKETSGYQIRYSQNKSFKSAKVKKITGIKKNSCKISNLKPNKKNYLQIRTYKKVGNKYYYSAWSKSKAVKTR